MFSICKIFNLFDYMGSLKIVQARELWRGQMRKFCIEATIQIDTI